MSKNVGIFVFDDIEVLDLGGPFEVFSVANRLALKTEADLPFDVLTISQSAERITARGGYVLCPSHRFADAPPWTSLLSPAV